MKKIYSLFIILFLASTLVNAQEEIKFSQLSNSNFESYNMANTTNGKFIYKSGGQTYSFKGNIDAIETYNPADDTWKIIGQGLVARSEHNIEYVPSLNKLYIFNGEYSPTNTFNPSRQLYASRSTKIKMTDVIEIIDLNTNTVSITESNPYPVSNAGSAVWNNKIYFFGGWNPMGYSDRFYEYDPEKDDWEELDEMPESKRVEGKIVDGVLYTIGGYDNGTSGFKTIHAYDFKTEKWSLVMEMPVGVSAHALASDGRNIWIVGNYTNVNFLAAFDTKTKSFKTFKSNMQGRRFAGAEVIGTTLYVFGGNDSDDRRSVISSTQCADISKYLKD